MAKSKKTFICNYEGCASSFSRPGRLESHLKLHTNVRPYICTYDDCDKSYTQLQHLKRHEEIHEGCHKCTEENCHQIFKSKSTLKNHINIVHLKLKSKTYKCSFCNEQFTKHCWLKRHEFKHTGVRPYICTHDGCEKRFLVPSKLQRHLKVHEGYTCTKADCNQNFSKWTMYLKHLQVSHPVVHKCDICERQFSRFYNLKAHSIVHNTDREVFSCSEPNCSRFYFAKRNLTHHIKSYHEKRPFICKNEDCLKAFKSEAEMNKHYLNWHDLNKPLKKKKKNKHKPSFAEKLAGCIPEKKKTYRSHNNVEVTTNVENETLMEQGNEDMTQCKEPSVTEEIQTIFTNRNGICKTVEKLEYVSFEKFVKI